MFDQIIRPRKYHCYWNEDLFCQSKKGKIISDN